MPCTPRHIQTSSTNKKEGVSHRSYKGKQKGAKAQSPSLYGKNKRSRSSSIREYISQVPCASHGTPLWIAIRESLAHAILPILIPTLTLRTNKRNRIRQYHIHLRWVIGEYGDIGDAVVDTYAQHSRSEVAKVVSLPAPLAGLLYGVAWKIDVVLRTCLAALPSPEFGLVRSGKAMFMARADI